MEKHEIALICGAFIGMGLMMGCFVGIMAFNCHQIEGTLTSGLQCIQKEALPYCKTTQGEIAIEQLPFKINLTGSQG